MAGDAHEECAPECTSMMHAPLCPVVHPLAAAVKRAETLDDSVKAARGICEMCLRGDCDHLEPMECLRAVCDALGASKAQ